jgi:alkylated DNA nucleotide flippase Atl1
MSIEHILPQTLSSAAREEFSSTLAPGQEVDEAHQELVHTMGNLTLTNYNTELSNSPFSLKRAEKLLETGVIGNQKIAEHSQWGPEEIRSRSKAMAEVALQIWPGPNTELVGKEPESMLARINEVIELVEPGFWTTYGDIAQTVGTVGQVVGSVVARPDAALGAWRVLLSGGIVSPQFRWAEGSPMAGRSCEDVLESEGIRFVDGRADESQRLTAEDLEERLGIDRD